MALQQASPKKIYIRVDESPIPGGSSLLYLPFNDNFNDESGNSITVSKFDGNDPTYSTTGSGEKYATVSSSRLYCVLGNTFNINSATFSCWIYKTGSSLAVVAYRGGNDSANSPVNYSGNGLIIDANRNIVLFPYVGDINTNVKISLNTWHNIVIAQGSGQTKVYLDGSLEYTTSKTYTQLSSMFRLFANPYTSGYIHDPYVGSVDEIIMADGAWTATEVLNYYNNTKSNYGIS